jgi:hypothetical protein
MPLMNHDTPALPVPSRRQVLGGCARLLSGGLMVSAVGGLGLSLLSGCSNLPAGLRNFEISADQLRQALAGQFPQQKRLLEVFDVTLSLPTLKLNPEANRIDTSFDVALLETLITRRVYRGSIGFGSGVRYEPVDHSMRLQHVSLDKLALPGVPSSFAGQLQSVAKMLAESLLEGLSVYHMPKGMAQLVDTLGTQPEELKVTATGVAVSFKPMRL